MSDNQAARAAVWTVVVILVAAIGASIWLGQVVVDFVLGGN